MLFTTIGIDVGGLKKGFHAVALRGNQIIAKTANRDPELIVSWVLHLYARVIAIDAPCRWSKSGSSRYAERELYRHGVRCFYTPSKETALQKSFYGWMLNGEKLYDCLSLNHYPRFEGHTDDWGKCIETFPHAIVWAMSGLNIPAGNKRMIRREILFRKGYDVSSLTNIDYIDAVLCAIAANELSKRNYRTFGNREEGFIILPLKFS
jgi:predicted nuclease with RNAse H fold